MAAIEGHGTWLHNYVYTLDQHNGGIEMSPSAWGPGVTSKVNMANVSFNVG